jgi:hypothetical protein
MKFGIYTSFYNNERFIERIFQNIERINYEDFEWHITDDFSTDNTKELLLNRIELSPIKDKIKFISQSEKKEMYWKPNLFFDNSFEWIVLIDSDDEVDSDFLTIYNNILLGKTKVVLVSSDAHKINEESGSLHSILYVLNDDMISKKIERYHPKCDYLNNVSYSCFGHLRAFRNVIDEFKITNSLACAEDSYHVFWSNSFGEYLHIPRPLYKWYLRNDSESHGSNIPTYFNDNFDIALNKLKQSDYGVDISYNDVYIETCSLGSYEIGQLKNRNVSLWTRVLSTSQKEKLKVLYFDVNLTFNDEFADIHIISLNFFNEQNLNKILQKIKGKKMLFYYQNQNFHETNEEKDFELSTQLNKYKSVISNYTGYSWWLYIRHFIIKN